MVSCLCNCACASRYDVRASYIVPLVENEVPRLVISSKKKKKSGSLRMNDGGMSPRSVIAPLSIYWYTTCTVRVARATQAKKQEHWPIDPPFSFNSNKYHELSIRVLSVKFYLLMLVVGQLSKRSF